MSGVPYKRVLVTGSSRGLGAAIAIGLARPGATIFVTGREPERLERVAGDVERAGATAVALRADLASEAERTKLSSACTEAGGVDVVVHNAAVWEGKGFDEVDSREASEIIDINLRAPIDITHRLLPAMVANRSGHLIFIGSTSARFCAPASTVYAATKFGLWGFARALRTGYRERGIKVTTIVPGSIASDLAPDVPIEGVREAHKGARMPTSDVVRCVQTVLALSDMALAEEIVLPAMMDNYGD